MGSDKQRGEGKRCGGDGGDAQNDDAIGEMSLIRGDEHSTIWGIRQVMISYICQGGDICVRFCMVDICVEGTKVGVDWLVG